MAGARAAGRRFLNRLLGLPVEKQNLLFAYFAATLSAEVSAAKAEGRFFEGFSDLGGSLYGGEKPQPQVPPVDKRLAARKLPLECAFLQESPGWMIC